MTIEQCGQAVIENERKLAILAAEFAGHEQYTKLALDKAETVITLRLNGMNEFREQLREQAGTFITTPVYDVNHKLLEAKIEALQKIIWTGIGMVVILQVVLQIAMRYLP